METIIIGSRFRPSSEGRRILNFEYRNLCITVVNVSSTRVHYRYDAVYPSLNQPFDKTKERFELLFEPLESKYRVNDQTFDDVDDAISYALTLKTNVKITRV